jgi:hypothetical protein
MTINGLNVQSLPIDALELDTQNPRIRKWLEHHGGPITFEQMLLALGAGSGDLESGSTVTFQSLKDSIRAQGGIINPIIVLRLPDRKYRVIEGNTRVAIYRSFREDGVQGDWDTIPAIVHESLASIDIDAIRLQCHIVGPRPWDPYSKAKYLNHLLNVENVPLTKIVELCGGRKKEIVEYIEAYHDMEKFYRPVLESDSDFDPTRFSAFVELQKAGVKQSIYDAGFDLKSFAEWIRDWKVDPLNTVRAIPRILKNPQAKTKFLAVGAREAIKILEVPAPPALANVPVEQLLRTLIDRLNLIPFPDVKAMRGDPGSQKAQLLLEAQEILADVCREITGSE